MEIQTAGRRLLRLLGVHEPIDISLEDLTIPDSKIANEATTLITECEPDYILNHSMRTYLFGAAIARHHNMKFDAEVFLSRGANARHRAG